MSAYRLFWGELHNHNEIGYGQGSLARSFEIARSHLDFYAFTPHAQHADGGAPEGYAVVVENWEAVQKAAAENNEPGAFTTFLGYEWHSNAWGHVHVVYFDDDQPLHFERTLADLRAHFKGQRAILIPHHIAYLNGVDWELFDGEQSPVVEIYSEHGCSERDYGPFPMLGHSGGPGGEAFTAQHGLASGKRFGFTAGTDNHDGHPGGYGLGLTGVRAEANTREAISEAILNRRTLAVTGDRIDVDLNAGEFCMGSSVPAGAAHDLRFDVEGWDFLKHVELIRNNVPVLVRAPDCAPAPTSGDEIFRLRFEWGWGPMKGYQVFDWEGMLSVEDGELRQVVPCFCSDPFDEGRRKRVLGWDASHCRWQSHTSRGSVFTTRNSMPACSSKDGLCVEVAGSGATRISLKMDCKTRKSLLATPLDWSIANSASTQVRDFTVGELVAGSQGFSMGKPPAWVRVHRAVPKGQYTLSGEYRHPDDFAGPAYYYVRVTQENGQMAWSSPIWLEA